MQPHTELPTTDNDSLIHKLGQIGRILRLIGWLGIVTQIGLGVAAGVLLLFSIAGRNFNIAIGSQEPNVASTTPGLGIAVFWAVAAIAVLLYTAFLAFRQLLFARRLRHANHDRHPKKSDIKQVLRLGIIAGFIGMALAILGGGSALGVLLSKSISQPQGVAIYDPTRIIRPLDVFVAMANMIAITAHFLGTIASVATVNWLSRQ
ncbi:DUF3611 family protein [Pseudanabaenaceae cyanobacterium LEGE 13415]|nr:DUF3611 family protein [Pseudanabaenaceae cyanobacterium LEGE 13415]